MHVWAYDVIHAATDTIAVQDYCSIGGSYCRAMRHFLDCHGNYISSLRGSHSIQGEVVRWVRVAFSNDRALRFEPLLNFFLDKWPPNLRCIPFWLGNTGYSVLGLCMVPSCGRANTATLELNIPLYCPPCHAIILCVHSLNKGTKVSWLEVFSLNCSTSPYRQPNFPAHYCFSWTTLIQLPSKAQSRWVFWKLAGNPSAY
jgi:hypothetical protein